MDLVLATAAPILRQTPTWVFAVFFLLLGLGILQSRPRKVGRFSLMILPIAMTALSLFSVQSAFGISELSLGAWTAGLLFALLLNAWLKLPHGLSYDLASARLAIPGSWIPMALMMAIFFTKYFISASLATRFLSREVFAFVITCAFALGLFSGTFVSRAVLMWRTTQHRDAALVGSD